MSSKVSSSLDTNPIPKTAQQQDPEQDSESTKANHPWPGKSEPGHIRPIGPAYRAGTKPSSDEVTDSQK